VATWPTVPVNGAPGAADDRIEVRQQVVLHYIEKQTILALFLV
jgi:hypothetical protein